MRSTCSARLTVAKALGIASSRLGAVTRPVALTATACSSASRCSICLFGELALGDIALDAAVTAEVAVFVENGNAAGFHDDFGAVLGDHRVLQHGKRPMRRGDRAEYLGHPFRFRRRHEIERCLAHNLIGRVAKQLRDGRRVIGVAAVRVDLPHIIRRRFDQVAVALLALANGLLRLAARGRVAENSEHVSLAADFDRRGIDIDIEDRAVLALDRNIGRRPFVAAPMSLESLMTGGIESAGWISLMPRPANSSAV